MIVMSHCEPTLSRFSILMLNNVVERTSRCFWISHHVPESAVAVLAAKKSAPLELRNDFLRERIEVYGHDRERSEVHTSELQSLMRSSYAVFRLKKNTQNTSST